MERKEGRQTWRRRRWEEMELRVVYIPGSGRGGVFFGLRMTQSAELV